eukprot:4557535-Alexandrium_andersonii.AAC.1
MGGGALGSRAPSSKAGQAIRPTAGRRWRALGLMLARCPVAADRAGAAELSAADGRDRRSGPMRRLAATP